MSLITTGLIQEFLTTHQPNPYQFQIVLSGIGPGIIAIPEGVYEITVGCWGGGAAGFGSLAGGGAGGLFGGGGGAYAQKTYSVSPGDLYSYNVGHGGDKNYLCLAAALGGSGGTTYFGDNGCNIVTATVRAMGGGGKGAAGLEGETSQLGGGNLIYWPNVGDITYKGGNGANGTSIVPYKTGGGGGGAGSTETGHYGSQNTGLGDWASGGTASIILGGAGGAGFYLKNQLGPQNYGSGLDAYNYGGGGGGSGRYAAGQHTTIYGGNGAQGLIIITCKR